jgi:hypothetical protein
MATGAVLLAFFPGSGEATNGAVDYHGIGAFAAITGGNALVILLGRNTTQRLGRVLVALGVTGLISLAAFLAVVTSGAGILIGLVERGAVYPFLIGLICTGAALRNPGAGATGMRSSGNRQERSPASTTSRAAVRRLATVSRRHVTRSRPLRTASSTRASNRVRPPVFASLGRSGNRG